MKTGAYPAVEWGIFCCAMGHILLWNGAYPAVEWGIFFLSLICSYE
jgi:hypothetical protein